MSHEFWVRVVCAWSQHCVTCHPCVLQTRDGEGLLLYAFGSQGDYMALELVAGGLVFVVDAGGGRRIFRIGSDLDDNRWHSVRLKQTGEQTIEFKVDNELLRKDLSSPGHTVDLNSLLFVGGVTSSMYKSLPNHISSRKSFAGRI